MNSEFSRLESCTRDSEGTAYKLDFGLLKEIQVNLNDSEYPHEFSFERSFKEGG